MAVDPNPTLRAELVAALAVLAKQIGGLHDWAAIPTSVDLKAAVTDQINFREHRRDLILAVIAALDTVIVALQNLENDGYPTLDNIELAGSLLAELQEKIGDLSAGASVFAATQQAATALKITLGAAIDKP